ncbi:MAG: prepilin-type N-terminal cleavage/methylation domain-containing protein [Candidatus Omnitrophica bacterium]|nr:prepilin-type N-terminal cleavage/methylation domain-containing protein [Candidatus Omnitrophota bacterium]
MQRNKHAFTLTELVVVLAIFSVFIGLFSTVFVHNWGAYEERIKRANLWGEANQCFEQMSLDGRNARLINVATTGTDKTATFYSGSGGTDIVYTIANTGQVSRTQDNTVKIFTTHADFANSSFTKNGKNLIVNFRLLETIFTRTLHVDMTMEILPRN